jgi:hypothetical protein
MKKTGIKIIGRFRAALVLAALCCLSGAVYGQNTPRPPIDINLIIDGSAALSGPKDEITAWVLNRLDQILVDGDRITVWNAGASSSVVYTGSINSGSDRDAVKSAIQGFSGSGNSADFSSALRDASMRQSSSFSYTLLISATPAALSSILQGPQANLLRYSRIEEFTGWRALVVGLNLDAKVRKAAADFLGS